MYKGDFNDKTPGNFVRDLYKNFPSYRNILLDVTESLIRLTPENIHSMFNREREEPIVVISVPDGMGQGICSKMSSSFGAMIWEYLKYMLSDHLRVVEYAVTSDDMVAVIEMEIPEKEDKFEVAMKTRLKLARYFSYFGINMSIEKSPITFDKCFMFNSNVTMINMSDFDKKRELVTDHSNCIHHFFRELKSVLSIQKSTDANVVTSSATASLYNFCNHIRLRQSHVARIVNSFKIYYNTLLLNQEVSSPWFIMKLLPQSYLMFNERYIFKPEDLIVSVLLKMGYSDNEIANFLTQVMEQSPSTGMRYRSHQMKMVRLGKLRSPNEVTSFGILNALVKDFNTAMGFDSTFDSYNNLINASRRAYIPVHEKFLTLPFMVSDFSQTLYHSSINNLIGIIKDSYPYSASVYYDINKSDYKETGGVSSLHSYIVSVGIFGEPSSIVNYLMRDKNHLSDRQPGRMKMASTRYCYLMSSVTGKINSEFFVKFPLDIWSSPQLNNSGNYHSSGMVSIFYIFKNPLLDFRVDFTVCNNLCTGFIIDFINSDFDTIRFRFTGRYDEHVVLPEIMSCFKPAPNLTDMPMPIYEFLEKVESYKDFFRLYYKNGKIAEVKKTNKEKWILTPPYQKENDGSETIQGEIDHDEFVDLYSTNPSDLASIILESRKSYLN